MLVDEKGRPTQSGDVVPAMTERQEEEAESRTSVTALVVHEAIRKDGDEELNRPISALAWSGLSGRVVDGIFFSH